MLEDIFKVVILSLVEGVTEFLPVSSTGHLIVGSALLKFDSMGPPLFEVFIQIGAVAAVVVYYRRTLLGHVQQFSSSGEIRRFWRIAALACAPALAAGLLFGAHIEAVLISPQVIAFSLILGGIAFLIVERLPRFRSADEEPHRAITDVTGGQAMLVGLVQALSLIPGVSRSGSSIIGGMLAGMHRQQSTEFSFFVAIPLLGGATVYKFVTSLDGLDAGQVLLLMLGAVLSALFAWLAIDWLLKFITRHSFVAFGYYRIAAGGLILAAIAAGLIS